MTKKKTNPKDALGIKKAPLSTLPTGPAYEVGLAMLEGARKYGRHNYRAVGVRGSVYYDAALRHLCAWWEGEDIDPDSGLSHIVKAAACLFVLRDSMLMENWVDDRPPKYPDGWNMGVLNRAAETIIEKYPDCAEPFTEVKLTETEPKLVICNNITTDCSYDCPHGEPHARYDACEMAYCMTKDSDGHECKEIIR